MLKLRRFQIVVFLMMLQNQIFYFVYIVNYSQEQDKSLWECTLVRTEEGLILYWNSNFVSELLDFCWFHQTHTHTASDMKMANHRSPAAPASSEWSSEGPIKKRKKDFIHSSATSLATILLWTDICLVTETGLYKLVMLPGELKHHVTGWISISMWIQIYAFLLTGIPL